MSMELASPYPDEPVTQLEADVPIEPLALQVEAVDLELALHSYERPLAVSPFGTPEPVPDWQDAHAHVIDYAYASSTWKMNTHGFGSPRLSGSRKEQSFSRTSGASHHPRLAHRRLIESLDCEPT